MKETAQNGKGSTRRRMLTDREGFSLNWDSIFGEKKGMWIVSYGTFSGYFEEEFETKEAAQEFYDDNWDQVMNISMRQE